MKTSPNGIALIARFEGFRSRPYKIKNDPWTIGYGETKGVGPNTGPWSEPYARQRLQQRVDNDFAPYVAAAARDYKLKLNQNQFDALVSAVYNLGPGVLHKSRSLGAALKAGGKNKDVAKALGLYVMPGSIFEKGLRARRAEEAKLYATSPEHPKLSRWRAELAALRVRRAKDKDLTRRAAMAKRINELVSAIKRHR